MCRVVTELKKCRDVALEDMVSGYRVDGSRLGLGIFGSFTALMIL